MRPVQTGRTLSGMKVQVVPILAQLRALYDVQGVWPRYLAYKALMLEGPELLPLGAFSPMGQRQPAYLNTLLGLGAERVAEGAALEVAGELDAVTLGCRVLLVVTDEPRNGWTQRWLTDAEWRFAQRRDVVPGAPAEPRWVTVQLWTDVEPTAAYVRQEVRAALYRAAHQQRFGRVRTLRDMLRQEGRALAFAGDIRLLDREELTYTGEVLTPLLDSTHYPTQFAAMYGDEIARAVGYPPLGLARLAGFALAVAEAGDPRAALRARMNA